ncbi:SPX domain-containing protein [Mycena olivaceomarginata]|nr:SPX domain-containing protein [Mycena olivaceomarginata]
MKFAQFTPEWKRKYMFTTIDCSKKRITAIKKAYGAQNTQASPVPTQINPEPAVASEPSLAARSISPQNSLHPTISVDSVKTPPPNQDSETAHTQDALSISSGEARRPLSYRSQTFPVQRPNSRRTPSFTRMFSSSQSNTTRRFTKLVGPKPHPYSELPLRDLMPLLSPPELAFFTTLDAELEKIEAFYVARENEMKVHTQLLELQLNELDEHKRLFDATYPSRAVDASTISSSSPSSSKRKTLLLPQDESPSNLGHQSRTPHLDPDEFHNAKHKLKKAVLEHYRSGLETLRNYRILNVTGIRKALKKFSKSDQIMSQVDKAAFASEDSIRTMMDQMEAMYTARFAHGDKKRALTRLRSGLQHKSHHISTFWSGLLVGLAVPAFVSGLYQSFQQSVRDSIPGWDGLLFVYGVCLLPVVFSWLLEFDIRTRLDHREYFGSLAISTLLRIWLSFSRIGAPSISPTVWPVVWLGFAAVVMFDPFPILFKPSRYWLIRNVAKLLTSGTRRVEVALVFTLSNLNLVVCLYVEGFNSNWRKLWFFSPDIWPLSFFFAILPFLCRAGKYGAGIVSYLCYFIWRHKGGYGVTFGVWIVFQTIYSIYALAWDLLVDWSILSLKGQYPPATQGIGFIGGVLEMLRRENEHIGNVDQYRVTREVPLPYSLDEPRGDDADDDDDDGSRPRKWGATCMVYLEAIAATCSKRGAQNAA